MYQARTFAMPISNNCSDESAPERGIEPPAQGNTLGNKGNITDGALTGQKHYTAYNTQDVALGYLVVGLSDRHCAVVYSLIGCYEENDCLSVFHPVQYNTKSVTFRGSVNGCVLSRGSVLRTSPPACILSCLWHYFI